MSLAPYQIAVENSSSASFMRKKEFLSAYLHELEHRLLQQINHQPWSDNEKENAVMAKKVVVKIAKSMNEEWNAHAVTSNHNWMVQDAFIQLATIMFDFKQELN